MIFKADEAHLTQLSKKYMASGTQNVFRARFELDESYDGFTVTAIFRTGDSRISVMLDEEGYCTIPWESLVSSDEMYVGLYAVKGTDAVLTTNWCHVGRVIDGAKPGDDAQEPTPDIYQSLIDATNRAIEAAKAGGLPEGGRAGQVLAKVSDESGHVEWKDPFTYTEEPNEQGGTTVTIGG